MGKPCHQKILNVYNSAAFNVNGKVFRTIKIRLQQAVDLIADSPELRMNVIFTEIQDDRNVLVDYGFEQFKGGIELSHEEEGVVNQSYQGYSLYTSSDTERHYFGNVMVRKFLG